MLTDFITTTAIEAWQVLGQMAPYLLFGFFIAGCLSVALSPQWVERHLGGRGFLPVFKSALFGVPLPLCSCGVLPVATSIRNHGAGRGATTGFLLSTPQTGVDSILATYALLGPVFAIFRPLAALIMGVVGGMAVAWGDSERQKIDEAKTSEVSAACTAACCADKEKHPAWMRALRYGFITLPGDISRALLFGVILAALISALLPQNAFAAYLGGGLVAMLLMMLVGIPIYVCSTASIPIAVGFMHMGASPGAALVFLITGPATNAAAISVIWKVLGRRTAIIYIITVALGALLSGLCLDAIFNAFPPHGAILQTHAAHAAASPWWNHIAALLLLGVLLGSRWFAHPHSSAEAQEDNEKTLDSATQTHAFQIDGMRCSHCVATVTRALREIEGVETAHVDLATGEATVTGENVSYEALVQTVCALGYTVALKD